MTPAQLTSLRTACFNDPTAFAFFSGPGDAAGLRAYLNGASGTNVWKTDASVDAILDAIDFSKYTPSATIAGAESEPLLTRKVGWVLEAQIKQMNLQIMLQGRTTIDASKPNVRNGLRDAVIQLPTGVLDVNGKPGLTTSGGASGATVLGNCVRSGTRAELMLAAASQGSDTIGGVTARVATFQGQVTEQESAALIYKDDGSIWAP